MIVCFMPLIVLIFMQKASNVVSYQDCYLIILQKKIQWDYTEQENSFTH